MTTYKVCLFWITLISFLILFVISVQIPDDLNLLYLDNLQSIKLNFLAQLAASSKSILSAFFLPEAIRLRSCTNAWGEAVIVITCVPLSFILRACSRVCLRSCTLPSLNTMSTFFTSRRSPPSPLSTWEKKYTSISYKY